MALYMDQNNTTVPPIESKSKVLGFLEKTDIFKYVPVPKLHPVSTTCSKIGSVMLVMFLIGFFIFSLYAFFAQNEPITNALPIETASYLEMNQISFSIVYYNSSDDYYPAPLIDPSILTVTFYALYNSKTVTTIPLIQCGSSYCVDIDYMIEFQKNNTDLPVKFVSKNNQILLYYKDKNKIQYKLKIKICSQSPNCLPFKNITQILSNTALQVIIRQAKGFNYLTGQSINPSSYYYQYLLSTSTNSLIQLQFQATIFKYQPDLLTTFKQQYKIESRMNEQLSFVNPYPSTTVAVINMVPDLTTNLVTIAPKTIVETLSLWFSFTKMILTAGLIIFVGWNRKKFDKANPEWTRFENTFTLSKNQSKQFQMSQMKGKGNMDQSARFDIRENLNEDQKQGKII